MLKTSLSAALCTLLLIAASPAAHAADPMRVATMLTTAVVATGERITYEKVAAKGDDIVFTNAKLTIGHDNIVTVPSLVISGVTERPGGGFSAKRITFDGGSAHATEGESKWATGLLEDVIVPGAAEISGHAKIRPVRKLTLGMVALSQSAKGVPITIPNVTVDIGDVSDTAPTSVKINASGAKMPVGFITNPIGTAMISRMGYTEFTANVTVDASYDTAKNAIAINSLLVDAPNVGKLAISAKMSNTSVGSLANPNEAAEARAAARLDSLSVRFDDAGFVGKMLTMQAEIYGGSRDEVRDALVFGALPLVLNYVENAAFRQQFMDAASAFLTNPKNFTITAAPAMPVPLGEAIRTAVSTPLKLPDLLSPKVAANQ